MSRFGELLRAANNLKLLAAIGRSGGDLNSIADLLDNTIDSPQMVDSIRRFKAVAGGAEMLEQRYPPLQPDIERLIQLPSSWELGPQLRRADTQAQLRPGIFPAAPD